MTTLLTRADVDAPGIPSPGAEADADRLVRLATGIALWLSLLLVTYWWVADGGVTDLTTGWETGLTSVGRLTGLWSADLLLVQVIMMSRLPPLENAFGRDQLTRTHRVIGFLSFDLMLVHVATILAGYAGARWSRLPGTTWELITTGGGILLSVAGLVALCLVAATSIKKARGRLRYESWHLIHLYAYLGVGLALPHQLWTGQQFLSSPGRTVFWWTLWATAAGAIVIWRVALPLVRSLRHGLRVTSVHRESSDVVSVYLTGRRLDRLPVRAGQFLTVRFLDGPGWSRANPFSLSAAPDGRSLRITAKALGAGSARLAHLRPGTRVLFEGPYGRLSRPGPYPTEGAAGRCRGRHHPAAGAGRGPGVRARRRRAAVPLHRRTAVRRRAAGPDGGAGLQVIGLPGPRLRPDSVLGPAGGGDELATLLRWVPDLAERDVFLCGPTAWTAGFARLVVAAGVPRTRIHTESFGW